MTQTTQGSGMSSHRPPKSQAILSSALENALKQAGIHVGQRTSVACGEVLEAEGPGIAPQSLVIFSSPQEGVQIGARITIPECSKLTGTAATSDQALILLGALTTAAAAQKLSVQALAGANGLEGYMVSAHACDDTDADHIKTKVRDLRAAAQEIETALAASGELKDRILSLARVSAYVPKLQVSDGKPMVVPSFDTQVRDQMMKKTAERAKQ